ncbi:MAG: flagellar biosynthesis anti-sigma factor FlgM [Candidatus Sulfotelmatobacter sp.]|jgi:flagellar biosynthesis anti-sigma factor FlgM
MRIGLNNPDPQSVSTEQSSITADQVKKPSVAATQSQPATASTSDSSSETTGLSQDRVTLSALASQALGLPEVRQGAVDSLRQSISNGQYKLDPSSIADAMLRGRQSSQQAQR